MRKYVSPSGIAGCVKPSSCTWEWLWMGSRNKDTSRPTHKPMSSMWSHATWQNRQRPLCLSLTKPLARVKELPRSLPRGTRKPRLWLTHLNPTCMLSTNKNSRRSKKPQTTPRPRRIPLQRTCSCSTQTCCLRTKSTHGIRSSKSRWHLTSTQTYKAFPRKDLGEICTSHLMTA